MNTPLLFQMILFNASDETKKILFYLVISVSISIPGFVAEYQNNEPDRIIIFGDSITAGYGLEPENAFPFHIQNKIDEMGWEAEVVSAGVSGETSAGGLRRIDWVLQREVDIFVLELGGNDGLRGIDPKETKQNLQRIIDKVRNLYPAASIILAGMEAPPNMGEEYRNSFRNIYSELAENNDLTFIPFILENVGGVAHLNQPDGIHPTEEGHEIIAANLWKVLKPVLQEIRQ